MTNVQKTMLVGIGIFILCVGIYTGYTVGDFAGKAFGAGELGQARVDLGSARSELDTVRARLVSVATGITASVGIIEGLVSKAGIERDRIKQSRILVEAGREAVKALRGALILLPTDDSGVGVP